MKDDTKPTSLIGSVDITKEVQNPARHLSKAKAIYDIMITGTESPVDLRRRLYTAIERSGQPISDLDPGCEDIEAEIEHRLICGGVIHLLKDAQHLQGKMSELDKQSRSVQFVGIRKQLQALGMYNEETSGVDVESAREKMQNAGVSKDQADRVIELDGFLRKNPPDLTRIKRPGDPNFIQRLIGYGGVRDDERTR